ncbi:MAG: hypothetical protein IPK79_02965 [Vampirovibrionales bacterium]|nr:hypothetical protein [Vampirovibrionales bacterium]
MDASMCHTGVFQTPNDALASAVISKNTGGALRGYPSSRELSFDEAGGWRKTVYADGAIEVRESRFKDGQCESENTVTQNGGAVFRFKSPR